MGIEGLEHAADGVVNQAVRGQGFHVIPLDRGQGRRKHPILHRNLVLGGLGGAADEASDQGGQKDGQECHRQKPGGSH